jgi:radical S-adenosyl methionine domain-containing protein 2
MAVELQAASPTVVTIDFHVTVECNQECPYCWSPKAEDPPVDTATAMRIVEHVKDVGARRIAFTGGDPLKRRDTPSLVLHAREVGLEVALSTTGDELTRELLAELAPNLDLISLPIDGSSEEVSASPKKPGHLAAIAQDLEWLRDFPAVDVKLCTPVTRHNLADVPDILALVERYARCTEARVFYNVFQAFPRSMQVVDWDSLLVSDEEFAALERDLAGRTSVRVNFLGHETLDRLYVMVFPDGSLVVPSGPTYRRCGAFLEIHDLAVALTSTDFDPGKHVRHSFGWRKPAVARSSRRPQPIETSTTSPEVTSAR